MSTDEELIAQMALQEESPDDPRQRRSAKPRYAKSEFNLLDLKSKVGERVWVKCITDLKPWADENPLELWKDYFIKVEEAIMLDEKRFAVILHSQKAVKEMVASNRESRQEAQAGGSTARTTTLTLNKSK